MIIMMKVWPSLNQGSATMDIDRLKQQIQWNCDTSDARYAGVYSLCILLLRLRDLYKWEHEIPPWQEPEPADLMEWIEDREDRWEEIGERDFQPLIIDDAAFDPFDTVSINEKLRPFGLVYGAGYGAGMKPSFFLAPLVESRRMGELRIDIVDRELARDLFTAPAMRQGDQVFGRRSSMLFFLWDQLLEMRPSATEALVYALAQYDLDARAIRSSPRELGPKLIPVARNELASWIYHELGEVRESTFSAYQWHEIVSGYPDSPIEIYARAVKDLLADTHSEGLLGHIIEHRLRSSLGFYLCFMRSLPRLLFPEMRKAFDRFRSDDDWSLIEETRKQGYATAHVLARKLIELHEAGRTRGSEWSRSRILSTLLEPLGILGAIRQDS